MNTSAAASVCQLSAGDVLVSQKSRAKYVMKSKSSGLRKRGRREISINTYCLSAKYKTSK